MQNKNFRTSQSEVIDILFKLIETGSKQKNMSEHTEIKTASLLALLSAEKVKIIDVRSADAYNGWRMRGEVRGGHIKGAKSLPSKWLTDPEWINIVRFKQIRPEDAIVLYGYTSEECEQTASKFRENGYNNVSVYHRFIPDWSGNDAFPMERLEHYSRLVPAEWVKELISGEKIPGIRQRHLHDLSCALPQS